MRIAVLVALLFLAVASAPVFAQCSPSDSEADWPRYEDRRFDEDWSVLRGVDLSGRDHVWDRLKFIPLGPEEGSWLTLAGQVREREYYREHVFGESTPVQLPAYLLSCVQFSADPEMALCSGSVGNREGMPMNARPVR